MKERFLANDSSYTHIHKKYHKQLICNFSCILCVTTLQIGSTSATQTVVGVALLCHSRLLAFMNNLRVAYYVKSIPCWQNLSKKFRETSLTQVNDVRRETARMHPKPKLLFLILSSKTEEKICFSESGNLLLDSLAQKLKNQEKCFFDL